MFPFFESMALIEGKIRNLNLHQIRINQTFAYFYPEYKAHELLNLKLDNITFQYPFSKLKFSYKEQKEYETIEDDIAALETRLGEIDGEMASCARDFVKLNELTEEKTQLETQLEEKMDRWTYLEELAAKILQQNA